MTEWYCPKCGYKDADTVYCSCGEMLDRYPLPPFVGKLQEEIATIQFELAAARAECDQALGYVDELLELRKENDALKSKVEMLEAIECKYIDEIHELADRSGHDGH